MQPGDNETKPRILREAARLFAANGYEATSVTDISEAVGLGRGGLYHHIESKEDLLYEIVSGLSVEMVELGERLLREDLGAEEKVRQLTRRLMTLVAGNLPELTVFFSEFRALTGPRRREVVEGRGRFEAVWIALLDQGVEQGVFRPVEPLVVKGILGILNFSHLWLRPEGELSPEEVADLFAEFILAGLRAGDPSAGRELRG